MPGKVKRSSTLCVSFGPKNLPKLGKMFGQTMKGFKEGIDDDDDDDTTKKAKTEKAEKTEKNDEE